MVSPVLALVCVSLELTTGFVVPNTVTRGNSINAHVLRGRLVTSRISHPTHVTPPAFARRSAGAMLSSTEPSGAPQVAMWYSIAGYASAAAWLLVSYIALSVHPVASINAECGLRHNLLTGGQAVAFPLPVGWAVMKALHSAAKVGWDRLGSATYRRLNLGVAAASLWLAAAVTFGPAFACGYDLFGRSVKVCTALVHTATATLALGIWAKTVTPSPPPVAGHYVPRIVRGLVGSVWSVGPRTPTDDPDARDGGAALYALAAVGLSFFALSPMLLPFPGATIPTILGKRLSRAASSFTWLGAVVAYTLKDGAERGRLGASTFRTLRRGVAVGSAAHLAILAAKIVGVDGGGLLLAGRGLWQFYPSMVGAPKLAVAAIATHSALLFAACTPPSSADGE